MLEVYAQAVLGLENQWFCDKISVSTPEGETLWFPCYRWLDSDTRLFLRPATGMKHLKRELLQLLEITRLIYIYIKILLFIYYSMFQVFIWHMFITSTDML